jgi:hypothetical protein
MASKFQTFAARELNLPYGDVVIIPVKLPEVRSRARRAVVCA